jgi:hypothetical protein
MGTDAESSNLLCDAVAESMELTCEVESKGGPVVSEGVGTDAESINLPCGAVTESLVLAWEMESKGLSAVPGPIKTGGEGEDMGGGV